MCAKAVDVGTGNIVGAKLVDGQEEFTLDRDAFYCKPAENFNKDLAKKSGMFFIEREDLGKVFIVGDDALKFATITGNEEDYRRPMAKGVLNPGEEEAAAMVQVLIERVIGPAAYDGEPVAVTCPADPIEGTFDTVYHRRILTRYLKSLGYAPYPMNEALGIIYAEQPMAVEDDQVIEFTGVAVSFGAGMANLVLSWKAEQLLAFSCTRGGDWIDRSVAKVTKTKEARVTHIKENELDLNMVNEEDKVNDALAMYYEELLNYVFRIFKREFARVDTVIGVPLDIVVAGGTSRVPGFVNMVKQVVADIPLPFAINDVRIANDPLRSVVKGALAHALSKEKSSD